MTTNSQKNRKTFSIKGITKKCVIFSLILIATTACSKAEDSSMAPPESQRYTLTINSTWSNNTHPTDFPSNPHYSKLVIAAHQSSYSFWKLGNISSDGVKIMAETGATSTLNEEIMLAASDGQSTPPVIGPSISTSPSITSTEVTLYDSFPSISFVSMIAPSPDWFIGVDSVLLLENGEWKDSVIVDLYAYDSGTDSSATYIHQNSPESTRKGITKITQSPINGIKLGTVTFTKK